MNKNILVFCLVSLMVLGVGTAMGMHHVIKIQEKTRIGKYFTDSEGKTLYWFKDDSINASECSGSCLKKWPVFYREAVVAPKGIKEEDFGTIIREDGIKQTTFRGYPLYYCANDIKAGDVNRQGANIMWLVINPDNFPPK